jgi:hypothetical protein
MSLFTILVYFRVAPLQVDPHHDGVILAAAIAVSEGHPILSGAFSQYGPLPSLIQGFVLWIFNTQLLTLRFLTAVQCLAIGIALYHITIVFTTKISARLASFTWLLASCIWVTEFPGSLLPWPSILSTLLSLSAIIALIKSNEYKNSYFAYLAGILFGFAGFCRIQAFILLPIVVLICLLKFQSKRRILVLSIAGYLSSLIIMFSYLVSTGSVDDFIQQVIITPLFTYSGVGQGNNYNRFQFALYIIEAIGFVILFISTKYAIKKIVSKFVVVGLVTTAILGIHGIGNWIATTTIPIRLKVLIGEPMQNLVISPFYFAAVISIFLIISILLNFRVSDKQFTFPQVVVIVCAVGSLPQLYPQADVMHLWWIAPLLLPCIFLFIEFLQKDLFQMNDSILQVILISGMILGSVSALQFINRPWSEYQLKVLKGTFAQEEKVRSVELFNEIDRFALPGSTSFDCADGIYSVENGTYLAPDQWFVNWGFDTATKPRIGTIRVICDKSLSYAKLQSAKLEMPLIYYNSNGQNKSIAILSKKE